MIVVWNKGGIKMSDTNPHERLKEISKGLTDLMLTDLFKKHGVQIEPSRLNNDQKRQVKQLVQSLQEQADKILNSAKKTK